jgi:Ferrous iron transport protein B C terminus/Nucleoside recognition
MPRTSHPGRIPPSRPPLAIVNRRDFVKVCTMVAAAVGLSSTAATRVVEAAAAGKRPSVIWLHFQECTGCSESLLRTSSPDIAEVILDLITRLPRNADGSGRPPGRSIAQVRHSTAQRQVRFLASRVLTGDRSPFILELPPIRVPRLDNLLTKTWLRVKWYLGEAVPLFLFGTVLLFVLDRVGVPVWVTRGLDPMVVGLLGLPADLATVFVMGFLRRDYGAAGLFTLASQGQLTGIQSVVALTVMTLFMPCVANFLMIVKERGARVAFTILGVVTPIAILSGAALNLIFSIFHVSF